ncbi:hypothetical protein N7452_009394 [Penicillium brevicompactum]|uniref:Lipocalin-like domain-containing protein n=1 Tax=Penicillium brevicompactum TaxID=5074 RepID=A0A9W9Q9U6_PENBR|nr:hypothetical protein N7452_009394 [Penicillium brevicompactum]
METTRVGEKSLEFLRTRLLNAARKEAAALVAENFGSPGDIDRNFKSLFQAELGPHEMAANRTTLCNDNGNAYEMSGNNLSHGIYTKRAIDLSISIRDKLVGVWKVLEYSMLDKSNRNEKIHPWGPIFDGQIIFTPDGYINCLVEFTGQGQTSHGKDELWAGETAELEDSTRRSCSLCGKFFVEMTSIGPNLIYDLELSDYSGFRGQRFRMFVDFVKKDSQQFLITSLISDDSAMQTQETFCKV